MTRTMRQYVVMSNRNRPAYVVIVAYPGLTPSTAGEYRTRLGAMLGAWRLDGNGRVRAYVKRVAA